MASGRSKKSNPANNGVFIKATGAEDHASGLGINAVEVRRERDPGTRWSRRAGRKGQDLNGPSPLSGKG